MFGLVTSPNSDARNISDLKGKKLAIARQTITDFLTDVILAEVGQPDDLMERLDIRKIPVRLQMLLAGQADAALFPEPLLSIAEQAGGLVLEDDRRLVMPLAVVALSQSKATPETIKAFQEALTRAAKAINKEPAHYRTLMLELGLIPPQLAESFVLPPFDLDKVPLALPDRTLFEAYVKWLIKTGTLTEKPGGLNPPPFEEVVYQGMN
jgi:NitT/TauT family transport system substrate-binding protein